MHCFIILTFACLIGVSQTFVPASVMENVLFKLEGRFKGNLGKVSDSFTHDEIIKEGVIQAVVKYLNYYEYTIPSLIQFQHESIQISFTFK